MSAPAGGENSAAEILGQQGIHHDTRERHLDIHLDIAAGHIAGIDDLGTPDSAINRSPDLVADHHGILNRGFRRQLHALDHFQCVAHRVDLCNPQRCCPLGGHGQIGIGSADSRTFYHMPCPVDIPVLAQLLIVALPDNERGNHESDQQTYENGFLQS